MEQLTWKTVQRKVKDLIPYEFNPRTISEVKVNQLKKSYEKFGLVEIPVIDHDEVLIAGHQRCKIMIMCGHGDEIIDVRYPSRKLTEEEFKEYNVVSNIEFGDWDVDMLMDQFQEINFDEIGFDSSILEPARKAKRQEDEVAPVPIIEEDKTVVSLGDVFKLNDHLIVCGSATEVKTYKELFSESHADLLITDPPYNVDYEGQNGMKIKNDKLENNAFVNLLDKAFLNSFNVMKEGTAFYVFHADSNGLQFRNALLQSGLLLKQCLIWVKNSFVLGRQDFQWRHEPILYGWKPGAAHFWDGDRDKSTVIEDIPEDVSKLSKKELIIKLEQIVAHTRQSTVEYEKPKSNDIHPTMKPVNMIVDFINYSSKEEERVLDCFSGSFSTLIACEKTNRKFRGMDLDPKFVHAGM